MVAASDDRLTSVDLVTGNHGRVARPARDRRHRSGRERERAGRHDRRGRRSVGGRLEADRHPVEPGDALPATPGGRGPRLHGRARRPGQRRDAQEARCRDHRRHAAGHQRRQRDANRRRHRRRRHVHRCGAGRAGQHGPARRRGPRPGAGDGPRQPEAVRDLGRPRRTRATTSSPSAATRRRTVR